MKPSQLASTLRRMAAAIESSKNPSRVLVARDLKRTIAALEESTVDMMMRMLSPGGPGKIPFTRGSGQFLLTAEHNGDMVTFGIVDRRTGAGVGSGLAISTRPEHLDEDVLETAKVVDQFISKSMG